LKVPLRYVSAISVLLFLSTNASPQGANPFFVPPTYPGTGVMVTADFNGDGKPDLIFADGTVLLGKGDGTFTVGTPLGLAGLSSTALIATADFNGDGKPDVVVSVNSINTFVVFLGKGDGTFQAPIVTAVASPLISLTVGDLNGDGKPDVLAEPTPANLPFTYLGKGDGTFSAGVPSGGISYGTLADFNGDGKLDLLPVLGTGIQLGNGDGTFGPLMTFPAGSLTGFVIGDFDGDGKLDVAGMGNPAQIQVLFGNGDGTFHAGPVQVLPSGTLSGDYFPGGDLNGAGKTDLVITNGAAVQVLTSNGDGTFIGTSIWNVANQYNVSVNESFTVVVADFNGDGKLDVAASNTLLLGNGNGTLQGNPVLLGLGGQGVTGDFNKDSHPDLALVTSGGAGPPANLQIFLNDGKGNFTLANTYQIPTGTFIGFALAAAVDVNGDGNIDLVGYTFSNKTSGNVVVLLGNGDGSFGAPTYFPGVAEEIVRGFALADLNGDGKPDIMIVTANLPSSNNTFSVLLNNGDGTFGPAVNYFAADVDGNVVAADFNKDGKIDAAVGTDTHGIALLLGKGDGTFQAATYITNSVFTNFVPQLAVADFNGDGNVDLIASGPILLPSSAAQQGYQVLLGKGDATFTALPAVTNAFVDAVQVADFNGDGKLDLLGQSGSVPALVLGIGDGTFGSPLLLEPPGGTAPLVADFNGDGQPDIAIPTSAGLVLLLNTTVSGFQISASALSPAAIASGSSTTSTITLSPQGGFSGAVALTCSGLPAGASCGFAPASVANASGTSALTITTAAATPAGTYTVNVVGTSGSVTQQVSLTVTVTAPVAPDFSMTAGSGGTATVAPGQTATYALSLASSGGFGGSVTLTCSGAPAMAACSISPATVTLSGTTATTATVTVTTTAASQVLPGGMDAFRRMGRPPVVLAAWLVTLLALFSLYRARGNQRIRWAPAVMALLAFAGLGLASCGGGNSSGGGGGGTGTEAGTYTLTVSASATAGSTTLSHSAKLTLVVQ
jgi:FG-GAP-like repeat